jgi:hypothetical protein
MGLSGEFIPKRTVSGTYTSMSDGAQMEDPKYRVRQQLASNEKALRRHKWFLPGYAVMLAMNVRGVWYNHSVKFEMLSMVFCYIAVIVLVLVMCRTVWKIEDLLRKRKELFIDAL